MIKKKVSLTLVCTITAILCVVTASKLRTITKALSPEIEPNGRVYYKEEPGHI